MSKKLIYIKIIIIIICILFISMFAIIFNGIHKSVSVRENVVEETKEEKIVFDLRKPPSKQKNLRGHVQEYISQVYDYLFNSDIKWKNIMEKNPYSDLMGIKDIDNFYDILKGVAFPRLFELLFNSDNKDIFKKIYLKYPLNMDDIPVTENYKEKHPKPLFEEFYFIKKEDYETKKKYDKYLDVNTWLALNYEYSIGVNEEEKNVYVMETKNVEFLYEEDGKIRGRVVFDEKGNEMTESSIDTRQFTFKYTLDDKGYVDDVEFVDEIKLADDKYLDHLWGNVKG